MPFSLIVLAATGDGPYSTSSSRSTEVEFGLRYWSGESRGWQGSAKTPRKVREEWEAAPEEPEQ